MKRLIIFALLLALGAVALWASRGQRDAKVIARRMTELAHIASVSAGEGNIARMTAANKLVARFNTNVVLNIQVGGRALDSISTRNDLLETILAGRAAVKQLDIDFAGFELELAPDRESATVLTTASIDFNGEKRTAVQEMKFRWIKVGREWLISEVHTLRDLK